MENDIGLQYVKYITSIPNVDNSHKSINKIKYFIVILFQSIYLSEVTIKRRINYFFELIFNL